MSAIENSDFGDCGSSCRSSRSDSHVGLVVTGVGVATLVTGIVLLTNGRTTIDAYGRGVPLSGGVRLTPQGFTF